MPFQHVDLTYLDRLYKGDRARMERWVRIYLDEAPTIFERMAGAVRSNDQNALTAAAHELRPLTHYLGAVEANTLLVQVGREATTLDVTACSAIVEQLCGISSAISVELNEWLGAP